jgi:hypothetical protein
MRLPHFTLIAAVGLCLSTGGCREREVTSYRVEKEKEAAMPATTSVPIGAESSGRPPMAGTPAAGPGGMAGTPVATADGTGLAWTANGNWQAKPASAMRKGSYAVPTEGGASADLSITAFPGDVGGETANLNRWRGQLQLAPAGEAELAAAITRFEQGGLKFAVVDYDNGQQRLLGAIVPFQGSTWFFKLMGPAAPLAKEKPAFLEFLKTVKAATP